MPKSTFAGHPLHPQLITVPVALFPFSLLMDVLHLATRERRYREAADLAMEGAIAGAVAAGAAGAMDYAEIPQEHPAKPVARLHAGLNLGLIALSLVNLRLRQGRRRAASRRLPTLLSAVGGAALFVSAWYGGHLVYEHGLRVKGRDPIDSAPDARLPGDELLEETLEATTAGARR
jgi:uncharacterized membrane protein